MNVIISCDDKYVQHATVTIYSLLKNNPREQITLYVLTELETFEAFRPILDLIAEYGGTVHFKVVRPSLLGDVKISHHISLATYYRILIPQLITDIDKALYLDCDLLVLESISELYETELDDHYVAAVSAYRPGLVAHLRNLGVESNRYFNAGVLLLNLKKWRNAQLMAQMIRFATEQKDRITSWDQDVLNYFFQNAWKELDYVWNYQSHFLNKSLRGNFPDQPKIVHFTSSVKPWDFMSVHPLRREYYRYLEQTVFKDWKPKANDLTHRIKGTILRLIGYSPEL